MRLALRKTHVGQKFLESQSRARQTFVEVRDYRQVVKGR
jgi:hypothetical protein